MQPADPPPDRTRILVADDQPDVLDAIRLLLSQEQITAEFVQAPASLLQALEAGQFDLLLMDLNYARDTTSGREGLDLLTAIHALDHELPIVVMTGWGTMEIAVEALQHGVRDFIQKPWDNARLVTTIRRLTTTRRTARREAARRRRELEQARDIQRNLLPRALPALPGWDLGAACHEAASVGGDTYDVIPVGPGRLVVCVADVAGKGIPAALVAATLQAAVRSAVTEHPEPAALCLRVNRALCGALPPDRFVTFFAGLLDAVDGRFRFCNAGHNPPLLMRRGGGDEWLQGGGMVLGFDESGAYAESCVVLAPGDRLVLYTDGVTETRDATGDEFGDRRLAAVVAASPRDAAARVIDRIFTALETFGGDGQDDDRTVVVVKRAEERG